MSNDPFRGGNYSNIMVKLTQLSDALHYMNLRYEALEAKHNATLDIISWFPKPTLPVEVDEARRSVADALWPGDQEEPPPEA